MNTESWSRVLELFQSALEIDPEHRGPWLARRAANDDERAAVERMLAEDAQVDGPLDRSPALSLASLGGEVPGLQLGTLVGRYRVSSVIASGGMSTVYLAEQDRPRRRVALKTLRAGFLSESGLRRFGLEAEILGNLHHPGIAEIHESGIHVDGEQRTPYIAMEYVADSRDLLRHAAGFGLRERLTLFLEVCEAVHYAHQKGVVHRDLKPSNILVDEHGCVKVIDFGLARVSDHEVYQLSRLHTETGGAAGTLLYMSPEQLAADHDAIDLRSDVYALGVVLFELLSGEHPFEIEGKGWVELAQALESAEPRRLGAVNGRLRGELEWIAARALEHDPARRYPSVHELATDVHRYLEHEPVVAGPPSGWYRLRKLVRRHRLGFGVAVGVVAVAVVGLSTTLWQASVAGQRLRERNVQLQLASQTGDFLIRALRSIRPEVARGREPTLRDFVDEVARELEAGPPLQPELEESLRETLGDTYVRIGRFAEGAAQLARAVELSEELHGERDERSLQLRNFALGAQLYLEVGGGLAERVQATRELAHEVLGADHIVTATATYNEARCAFDAGDLTRTQALVDEAIAVFERHGEGELADEARRLRMETFIHQGDVRAASGEHEQIVSAREARDPLDPGTLTDERNELTVLVTSGRLEGTQELGEELLERMELVLGTDHPEVIGLHGDVGHELARAGRSREALRHLDRVRDACAEVLGAETTSHVSAMIHAGQGYLLLGRVDDAFPLLEAVLEADARQSAGDTFVRYQAMLSLSLAYSFRGDADMSEAFLTDALRGAEEHLGPDHFLTFLIQNNLALALAARGDLEGALAILEPAAARCVEVLGEDDIHQTLMLRYNLGSLLLEAGRHDEAELVLLDVLERRERVFGDGHGDVLDTRQTLSQLFWLTERREQAAELLGAVASERLARSGIDHPRTFMAVNDIAGMLLFLGREDEAQAWQQQLAAAEKVPVGVR